MTESRDLQEAILAARERCERAAQGLEEALRSIPVNHVRVAAFKREKEAADLAYLVLMHT